MKKSNVFSGATGRMLQFLDYQGESRYKFSKKTGLSNGFLSKNRNIGSDKCEIISEHYPKLSLDWLIAGRGSMLREEPAKALYVKREKEGFAGSESALSEESVSEVREPAMSSYLYKSDRKAVVERPIVEVSPQVAEKQNTFLADVKASAGWGSLGDNYQRQLESLPMIHLPQAPPGQNIAFQIDGDSMHPTIRHMDYVAATRVWEVDRFFRDGYTYVIIDRDDGVLCKRLYRLGKDWQVVSDNPIYKPYNRSHHDVLAIFRAFCRLSFDFRNYHDDLRAEMRQMRTDLDDLKQRLTQKSAAPKKKR